MTHRGSVLITGCSSGIGLDAARSLQARGWRVIATCRKPDDLAARRAEGMTAIHLELSDPGSVAEAARLAIAAGPVAALVNNAAFALPGAVEDLPRDGLRAIFETNLFGTHDLTRHMIAHFREQGAGRIVNISSVLGLVGIPWRGAYVATKFALEGMTDVLRQEMAGTGIRVVLIQPGPITSRIRVNAIPHFERFIDWQGSARAQDYRDALLKRLYAPSGRDRFELPPSAVSARLIHAVESARPRARYAVTTPTRMAQVVRRILPTRALDWVVRRS